MEMTATVTLSFKHTDALASAAAASG